MVIGVNLFQTELPFEIFSESLVRAIGKVLLRHLARRPTKAHKGDEKWPLFVNKQLFWWSPSITLDNNNVSIDFQPFFQLYTSPHTSVGLTCCISLVFSVLNILTHMTSILPVGSLYMVCMALHSSAGLYAYSVWSAVYLLFIIP